MTNIKKFVEEIKEHNKSIEFKFRQLFDDIFQKNENLIGFSWTQGTPAWNDGEPCEFGTYYEYDLELSVDNEEAWGYYGYIDDADGPEKELSYEIFHILNEIPDNFYYTIFGNDAKIYVERDKITIQDWRRD